MGFPKYIIYKKNEVENIIIFGEILEHKEVARIINEKIVSAGFCEINTIISENGIKIPIIKCFGVSLSLDIKSRKNEDTKMANELFYEKNKIDIHNLKNAHYISFKDIEENMNMFILNDTVKEYIQKKNILKNMKYVQMGNGICKIEKDKTLFGEEKNMFKCYKNNKENNSIKHKKDDFISKTLFI